MTGLFDSADLDARIRHLHELVLGRLPTDDEVRRLVAAMAGKDSLLLLHQYLSSAEYLRRCLRSSIAIHLYLIHSARVMLVSTALPPASQIVDLGGANGNLIELGYPHPFNDLIVVDLPAEERHPVYRNMIINMPNVRMVYSSITDLSAIGTCSTDLVWMGQVIEHVTEDDSMKVYREVRRILRPTGFFCLDTPNRSMTELHTGGPFIHPEHKIEYRPKHLKQNLRKARFRIEEELGLCEMWRTHRTGRFDYVDFITGGGLSTNVEACYIQYYRCSPGMQLDR